jgi:4-hydroxythreonine-4-phosphate dehydrogenase
MTQPRTILVTLGDPAGVSGEVVVKAWAALVAAKLPLAKAIRKQMAARDANLYVVGDRGVMERASRITGVPSALETVNTFADVPRWSKRLPLFEVSAIHQSRFRFGVPDYGREQLAYLDWAIEQAKRKRIQALVTGPVTKEAVAKILPGFLGHTGYLAEQLGAKTERMCFLTPDYLLALQTTHVPLCKVSSEITKAGIVKSIAMLVEAGKRRFGKTLPVAVLGLNPHAGEHGLLGEEEDRILIPAMKTAQKAGNPCEGPFPADSFFIDRVDRFRLILAMYHDQGLIAVKPAYPRVSVNVTLGLPVVRTSVDHGSGYDIAGKGKADETSMLSAIAAALELMP